MKSKLTKIDYFRYFFPKSVDNKINVGWHAHTPCICMYSLLYFVQVRFRDIDMDRLVEFLFEKSIPSGSDFRKFTAILISKKNSKCVCDRFV